MGRKAGGVNRIKKFRVRELLARQGVVVTPVNLYFAEYYDDNLKNFVPVDGNPYRSRTEAFRVAKDARIQHLQNQRWSLKI